jgi:tetratricopeptide (TPR) repeat protein
MLAYRRGDYDTAGPLTRQSLEINERLGNQAGMAGGYHQLGILAHLRGDYDTAESRYLQSLEINERLGNQADMASSWSQLGVLLTQMGNPTAAVAHFLEALFIRLKLGSPDARTELHWLAEHQNAFGDDRFAAILAEHLDKEGVDAVLGWVRNYREEEAEQS